MFTFQVTIDAHMLPIAVSQTKYISMVRLKQLILILFATWQVVNTRQIMVNLVICVNENEFKLFIFQCAHIAFYWQNAMCSYVRHVCDSFHLKWTRDLNLTLQKILKKYICCSTSLVRNFDKIAGSYIQCFPKA